MGECFVAEVFQSFEVCGLVQSYNTFNIFFNNKQLNPGRLGTQSYTKMQRIKVVEFYYQSQQSITLDNSQNGLNIKITV